MTSDEYTKLRQLRFKLLGTGLFCFEKKGTYFLYREMDTGKNTKIFTSQSIDSFVKHSTDAIGSKKK